MIRKTLNASQLQQEVSRRIHRLQKFVDDGVKIRVPRPQLQEPDKTGCNGFAIQQLCAAAEIAANAGPLESRFDAFQLLAFFRRYDDSGLSQTAVPTSNDELFVRTAEAALAMAGRKEFAASLALLEQAHSLLSST
jgi:hypothetical protein